MNPFEAGRVQARGAAMLLAVEAEALNEDPEALACLRDLPDELFGLRVAQGQYLAVRLRLAGADSAGYATDDLAQAATDLRFARGVVRTSVTRLAERLAVDPTEGEQS